MQKRRRVLLADESDVPLSYDPIESFLAHVECLPDKTYETPGRNPGPPSKRLFMRIDGGALRSSDSLHHACDAAWEASRIRFEIRVLAFFLAFVGLPFSNNASAATQSGGHGQYNLSELTATALETGIRKLHPAGRRGAWTPLAYKTSSTDFY